MRALLIIGLLFFSRAAAAQGIRDVDFGNRVWRDTCIGLVRTHDGSFHRRIDDFGLQTFIAEAPVFGDLDGDGVDEAIVPTSCSGGGTGHFSNATIFTLQRGRLRELARLGEGDRSDGGLASVRIEHGVIVEERYATEHGALDFEYVVTHRRVLRAGRLVEIDAATVACEPPDNADCVLPSARPAAVRFEEGRTDALRLVTFGANGRLPSLTIWALAGQQLDVDAWCHGTELTGLRVEAPGGAAVEGGGPNIWRVSMRVERSGAHRVSMRVQRPVGLCFALLGARTPPATAEPNNGSPTRASPPP